MHSNIIATVETTRRESQHHHHHNTTQVSTKKERKSVGERIKVTKRRKKRKKRNKEIESVEWQACTNRLIPSLPLKAYPLLRIKNSFGHKPFKPVPSKCIISTAGSSCEVTYVEEVVPSLTLVP